MELFVPFDELREVPFDVVGLFTIGPRVPFEETGIVPLFPLVVGVVPLVPLVPFDEIGLVPLVELLVPFEEVGGVVSFVPLVVGLVALVPLVIGVVPLVSLDLGIVELLPFGVAVEVPLEPFGAIGLVSLEVLLVPKVGEVPFEIGGVVSFVPLVVGLVALVPLVIGVIPLDSIDLGIVELLLFGVAVEVEDTGSVESGGELGSRK